MSEEEAEQAAREYCYEQGTTNAQLARFSDVQLIKAHLAGQALGEKRERERILNIIRTARCHVGGPENQISIGYKYLLKEINGKEEA